MSESDIDWGSNLVKHAYRELKLIGEEPETIQGYLEMISVFTRMGHSGGSASVFVHTLSLLLQFQNLKPLTNNPNEWIKVTDDLWQNIRSSDAFSTDGGKSYRRNGEMHDAFHLSELYDG